MPFLHCISPNYSWILAQDRLKSISLGYLKQTLCKSSRKLDLLMNRLNSEDFRHLGNLEILFIGLDQMIELVETFNIVPIFCEYFWIFLNKIVFEMVFGAFPKSATRCKVMLYMIRFLSTCCIFWAIWRRLGRLGKNGFIPKTDQKWDFTLVKTA